MRPNKSIIDEQEAQGYSFLYNVDPEHEVQYEEVADLNGSVREVPTYLTSSLSPAGIIAKHAHRLGVQMDRLRVIMDAYRTGFYSDDEGVSIFDPLVSKSLSKQVAVFVKTTDLEGVLERHPAYRAFQPTTQ